MAADDPPVEFELEMEDAPGPPTPDEVLTFNAPAKGYLCPLTANSYGIDFLSFTVRDVETNEELFRIARDPNDPPIDISTLTPEMEDQVRSITYDFGRKFLRMKQVGTTLNFSVGPQPVENFRMIERHYFENRLIKSFDFAFGFCIPNSTNSWEAIYEVPALDDALVEQMIEKPYATKSDSFYFVGDTLIMHNKAAYAYTAAGD